MPFTRSIFVGKLKLGGYLVAAVLTTMFGFNPARAFDNSALPLLGEKLFFDKRLSRDGTISCASCHRPELAFTDGRKLAIGIGERQGTRNTPSLLNSAFNTSQFWDGRRDSLETQALDPFLNASEHGFDSAGALLKLLREDEQYRAAFKRAFAGRPTQIAVTHVASAIAAFQRTLVDLDTPFDRFQFRNEKAAMSVSAQRGLRLFQGAARCASCHLISNDSALLTDNKFHALGVGVPRIERRLPALAAQLIKIKDSGGLDEATFNDQDLAELGRFAVTLNPVDIGKFRTPSLRNIALTAPYMHDGSVATLEEAVELEIYYRGIEMQRPLVLTAAEKDDLMQFLNALTNTNPKKFK